MSAPDAHDDESQAEFDLFAYEYDRILATGLARSGEAAEYFQRYKIHDCVQEFAAIHDRCQGLVFTLDFGAGTGNSIPYWREAWPRVRLTCADVSRRCLEVARMRYPREARFSLLGGKRLPFDDNSFDVIFAACVFHHIPHSEHAGTLSELLRVLRPAGALMIYEHNPFNPLTRRVVRDCPFDRDAQLIRAGTMRSRLRQAGFRNVAIRYRVFFPHSLRACRGLERWLGWLPLGAQYHAIGSKPAATC